MENTQLVTSLVQRVVENVEKVILGKRHEVEMTLIAVLCEGHLLIEDVPGVGKTMLARSIAKSIGCSFRRIQFTPDMLPSDVTGVSVFNQKRLEFEFRPGPVMAQIVLAAVRRAGSIDKGKIRDEIEKTSGYIGTAGRVSMSPTDHLGLDISAFHMVEVRKGDWFLLD